MNIKTPISSIMQTELTTVNPEQQLITVKHIFEKKKFHHHIPVVEDGKLKGMISLADFLFAIKGATLDDKEPVYTRLKVRDIMSDYPVSMPTGSTLEDVAKELGKGEVHAIAIADAGMLKGIVSTNDVIRYFLEQAEKA
jgi:CBS domain-containing protein